jgi:hypothetical protein
MLCLTIVGRALSLTTGTSSSNSLPDTTLQNVSSIANIVYTLITLAILIVAIWSLALTRKQMRENKRQSDNAIAAVRDQIKTSELQAQEALYNQHRPLLVCSYHPMAETTLNKMPMPIKNVGLGIALNIRGILSMASSINGSKFQTGFIISSVLTPNSEPEMVSINMLSMKGTLDKIGEYSFFPDDKDSSYNQRLVLSYYDIFNRKHLSIYDGRLGTNWKVYVLESNSKWSIEDVCSDLMILGGTTYGIVNQSQHEPT